MTLPTLLPVPDQTCHLVGYSFPTHPQIGPDLGRGRVFPGQGSPIGIPLKTGLTRVKTIPSFVLRTRSVISLTRHHYSCHAWMSPIAVVLVLFIADRRGQPFHTSGWKIDIPFSSPSVLACFERCHRHIWTDVDEVMFSAQIYYSS